MSSSSFADLSIEQATSMLDKIRRDATMPASLRGEAWRVARDAAHPALALERLQRIAQQGLQTIQRGVPKHSLARFVTPATFLRFHTQPEVRDRFLTADDFVGWVETSADRGETLMSFLSLDPVTFVWERSWLAELAPVRRMSGRQAAQALEMDNRPPYVRFDLALGDLIEQGVLVRTPCALDSVLGPNPQWRPGGPASGVREFVDGDVPREAITSLEWVE